MQVAAFLPAAPSAPAGVAPSSNPFSSAAGSEGAAENSAEFAGGFESLLDSQSGSAGQDAPALAPPKPTASVPSDVPLNGPSNEPIAVTASAMLLQMPVPVAVPAPMPGPVAETVPVDGESAEPTPVECTESEAVEQAANPVASTVTTSPSRGRPAVLPLGSNAAPVENSTTGSTGAVPTRGRSKDLPAPATAAPVAVHGHAAKECGDSGDLPTDLPATEQTAAQSAPTVREDVRQNSGGAPGPVVSGETPAAEGAGPKGPNENANAAAATAPSRGRPRGLAVGLVNGTANPRAETRSAVTRGTPIPLDEATETISSEAATELAVETPAPLATPSQAESPLPETAEPVTRGGLTEMDPRKSPVAAVSAEVSAPKPEGRGRPVPKEPGEITPTHGETLVSRSPGRGVPEAVEAMRVNAAVQFSSEVPEAETSLTEVPETSAPVPAAEPELPAASDDAPLLRVTGFHVERSRIRVTERLPAESSVRQLTAWPEEKSPSSSSVTPRPLAAAAETPAPPTPAVLLSAAPTLVQLSVDAAVVNRAVPSPKSNDTAEPVEAPAGPVLFDEEEFPVETITVVLPEANDDASGETAKESPERPAHEGRDARPGVAAGQSAAPRENPAASRGKSVVAAVVAGRQDDQKNFLSTDKQELATESPVVGTRMANQRPAMVASTLLPSAPETVTHETGPLLPVGTGRPMVERSTGTPAAENPQVRSYAAAAVREVMAAAEKLVPPRTTIELRLQAFDQENVRVQLVWRDGTIHARFVTETPELQQALNKEWDSSMPRFAEKGLKFSEASFEQNNSAGQGGSSQGAFSSEQHGRGRRGQLDRDFPEFALPSFLSAVTGRATSVPVDLPSMATAMQPLAVAPRGLRVWA